MVAAPAGIAGLVVPAIGMVTAPIPADITGRIADLAVLPDGALT